RSNGGAKRTGQKSEEETPQRIGKKIDLEVSLSSLEENSVVNNSNGDVTGLGLSRRKSNDDDNNNDDNTKRKRKVKKRRSKINSRIFLTPTSTIIEGKRYNKYKVILSSDENIENTDIELVQKA